MYRPPSGGPIRWDQVELPPDHQLGDNVLHPGFPIPPEPSHELSARLQSEWEDECAASRDPLIRTL